MGGILSHGLHGYQHNGDDDAHRDLQSQLGAPGKTEVAMMDDLQVVVRESNGSEGHGREDNHPDVAVGQVSPQQGWDNDRDYDQYSTHRRSTGFLLMGSWTFFPDVLPNLELA